MTATDQRRFAVDAPTVPALAVGAGGGSLSSRRLLEVVASRGRDGDWLCFEGDVAGEIVVVGLAADRTRIGRGHAADVRLDDPTVSRRHALIVRDAGVATVYDERSLNGVLVNGRPVSSQRLEHGDEIRLGRRRLCFARLAGSAHASVPAPPAPAPAAA